MIGGCEHDGGTDKGKLLHSIYFHQQHQWGVVLVIEAAEWLNDRDDNGD